jgi:hypothetical protein
MCSNVQNVKKKKKELKEIKLKKKNNFFLDSLKK